MSAKKDMKDTIAKVQRDGLAISAEARVGRAGDMSRYKTDEARAKHAEYQRQWRKRRPGLWRACRKRNRKKHKKEYREREKGKYPEKYSAKRKLGRAVWWGRIIKPKHCQDCGKRKIKRLLEGHHPDYSKPLEVVWLCNSCHRKRHRK